MRALILLLVCSAAYADTAPLVSQRTGFVGSTPITVCVYRSASGMIYEVNHPGGSSCPAFINVP